MARWSALTAHLATSGDTCHLTWPELDDLVGGLPASATRHRPWWSGDRSHVRAWRAAGFRLAAVSLGRDVTFVREAAPSHDRVPLPSPSVDVHIDVGRPGMEIEEEDRHAAGRVILIACSKSKLNHPAAAKDLYTSPLFRSARAYAERTGSPWFILSAEHGLVAPDEWLAPYDRYLKDTLPRFREAWGHWVVERLTLLVGGLENRTVEIHAGAAYVQPIRGRLASHRCRVTTPLEGLAVGERQHWYLAQCELGGRRGLTVRHPDPLFDYSPGAAPNDPNSFAQLLLDETSAVTPQAFLDRGPAGLKVPGLYSWWADEQAAADLTEGLGHAVDPGLIYAGLAGATRWPSGKRSTNTLWSRIAGMYLGRRHEFSTFRRTLGAIHAGRSDAVTVDEGSLTQWMHEHLRVLAAPYEDADALGLLETQVLRLLDPPLNLQGMPRTPLRRRLSELRRQVTRATV